MGHKTHPTCKPKQLQNNNTQQNNETVKLDSLYELLGFVKSAIQNENHEYSNIELSFNMELKE